MQVATLFRESSTLLGASMETGVGGGVPDSAMPGLLHYDYGHSVSFASKYKLNMKLESQDDGYETSADILLHGSVNEMKCEKMEDPYSFIDDDPIVTHSIAQGPPHFMNSLPGMNTQLIQVPKKRGRKKKVKTEQDEYNADMNPGIPNCGAPRSVKERKKHDRFNGMPEEEVSKRTLPDHLTDNLDIVIIGINPGLFAAYKGHHYAGPGNHFWKCLYLSGLTPQQMSADEDYKLLQVGIGFTNMVQRATKGSADLTRKEIKEGSQILVEKLRKFRPKIAVFNGKLIYEVFSGKKDFKFGRQPDLVEGTNTYMWVMPSSSARCAQLPRAADKVPFYAALKKFRDYLNGLITEIDESEMVFSEPRVKACYESEPKPDVPSTDISNVGNNESKTEETIIPNKKKRGRPKKIKVEGEEPAPKPSIKKVTNVQNHNCDLPKKKRGRPKKVKEDCLKMQEISTPTNVSHCYSSPPSIESPKNFYHMGPALTSSNNGSNLLPPQHSSAYNQSPHPPYSHSPIPTYNESPRPPYSQSPKPSYSQSPRPAYNQSPLPQYSQSPRPHSQSFTHSDLSSEISAAISSEQLGSPTSPSLGPPDFEPPTNMAEDTECRLSPAPSTNSEQQHFSYNSYNMETMREPQYSPRQPQDITSKSLSGLESLVDQIPSITDGETTINEIHEYPGTPQYGNYTPRTSPVPYNYPSSTTYPIYPTPAWSNYDPVPLAYPQLPYAQGYGPGLHVPSPSYPYYTYPQPAAAPPPGYPPYLGGF